MAPSMADISEIIQYTNYRHGHLAMECAVSSSIFYG